MPAISLMPIDDEEEFPGGTPPRKFLTFVVPAPEGCDLKCGFCVVRQRLEATGAAAPTDATATTAPAVLLPHHYARFIREAAAAAPAPLYAVSIQGYEPLLPASRPYTQAILATGRLLGIPTALVTNGTHLRDAADWLATLAPTKIAVSLDAADASTHDRLRGVPGAWAATVAGLERAAAVLAPRTSLAVASVLMPSGAAPLEDMPRLLAQLGIAEWIVTPLQKVGRDRAGGPIGERRGLYRSLARLQDAADAASIRLTIDDELDCLQHGRASTKQPELRRFRVRSVPRGVELLRLTPGGECSVGRDILRQVSAMTPRWRPAEENAGDFLARLTLPAAFRKGTPAISAARFG